MPGAKKDRADRQEASAGLIRPAKKPDLDSIYKGVPGAMSGVRDGRRIAKAETEKHYGADGY